MTAYFSIVTHLGDLQVLTAGFFLVWLFFRLRWQWWEARTTALLGVGIWLVQSLLKNILAIPRPEQGNLIPLPESYAFPSGHAAGSMVLYGWLVWLLSRAYPQKRWLIQAAGAAVILSVGVSRLYLGVHWPTDVLAGWLIGLLLVRLTVCRTT